MYVRWLLDEIEDFRFRRDAPARLAELDEPAVALRLRGRRRTCAVDWGSGPGESAGAVFSAGARRAMPGGAGRRSGRVGGEPPGGCGRVRRRQGRGRDPLHEAQGGGAGFPPCTSIIVALAGSELALGTGTTPAPPPPVPSDDHFLAPAFVQTLVQELAVEAFFGPIMRGAGATLGRPVDRHGAAVLKASRAPPGGTFLVRYGLLYRRGQGEADRLCIPVGGGVRAQVLRECHDGPLGGHFDWAKTGSLVRRLAFGVGQDREIAEYLRTCQTCQRTKAEHGGTADRVASSIPCRFPLGAAG
jgi:hypothetical protein